MEQLTYIFFILQIVFLTVLIINILYIFIFAIVSLIPFRVVVPENASRKKIAVLIPAYKEDKVIIEVASEAIRQNYPRDRFEVIVIADSFAGSTLAVLQQLPVMLIEVSFENSTKAKALNAAMSLLPDDYDIAVVLDADNIMAPDFLTKIDDFFAANQAVAVQGRRTAKNVNTSFAVLDAISEEITNQLFCKGQRILGFSSSISGSGSAFDYRFFKNIMMKTEAIGGYDKELEMRILREKHIIHYLPDACVFDEKVQTAQIFYHQRRRWLSAQFHYVRIAFGDALKLLFSTGNWDYFNKVFQWTLLPRSIILGLLFVLAPVCIIFEQSVFHPLFSQVWMILSGIYIFSIMIMIPGKFYNIRILKVIGKLPLGTWLMFKNLFHLKGSNQAFIHTEHGIVGEPEKRKIIFLSN